MLFGLITFSLSWFDVVTVLLPFLTILIVQLLNANSEEKNSQSATNDPTTAIKNVNTSATKNGKIFKQKSEQCEDSSPSQTSTSLPTSSSASSLATSSLPSSPVSSPRHSINNGSTTPHPPTPDSLTDEYHEDEDTLSLENLFPCDQSEIYASKKISFIIDELIQTEANYVNNLRKGLQNYGQLNERDDLPEALQGKERQQQLLGNIEDIVELHERQILPLMLRNQRDLKQLFDDFAAYFDKNNFYCYVIFTMRKKTSMQLRQEHREWFLTLQSEINDKLGIDSFLVQPIQRLTRYPLLLQQFISEFYKSGISCKPVLMSVCKLETRMRRLLEVVNQSEEIATIDELIELDLLQQGNFRRATEFDAYHHRSRKKYRAKLFLFDTCLLCTEVRKRRLAYRTHYPWDLLQLQLNSSKSVTLLMYGPQGGAAKEEYDLSAPEAISVTQWLRCARKIMEDARVEATQRGKFSLPMDLVMGVAAAIWIIWHYL